MPNDTDFKTDFDTNSDKQGGLVPNFPSVSWPKAIGDDDVDSNFADVDKSWVLGLRNQATCAETIQQLLVEIQPGYEQTRRRLQISDADFRSVLKEFGKELAVRLDEYHGQCRFTTWAMSLINRCIIQRHRWMQLDNQIKMFEYLKNPDFALAFKTDESDCDDRCHIAGQMERLIQQILSDDERRVLELMLQEISADSIAIRLECRIDETLARARVVRAKLHAAMICLSFSDDAKSE